MKSKYNILNHLSTVSKIELCPTDKMALWSNIERELVNEPVREMTFWHKRIVSIAGLVVCLCVGTGTVAWANGINVLNVVVQFVHNITNGGGFGSGYSLENTTVNLSASGSVSTSFVDMHQIPRLNVGNIKVYSIDAHTVDRTQQVFYMYEDGFVPNTKDETVTLGVFHNTGGDVVINGQTLADVKQQINVSGINATYVAFTNDKATINYITWKSGKWIFVLQSNNVTESGLVQYAQDIEGQVQRN